MRATWGRRVAAVIGAGSVLLLAACGDDDDDASTGADDEQTTDGTVDVDDLDEAAGFLDEDCRFLLTGAYLNPAAAFTPGGGDEYEEARAHFEDLADEAPDEISDHLHVIADRYDRMHEILGDIDLSDPEAYMDPEVQAALAQLEDVFDEEYQEAGEALSEYVAEHCTGADALDR